MYIIYIRNYKKRLVYLSIIIGLWILLFFLTELFFSNSLTTNITIENYLSFSCPAKYDIDNVYVNESVKGNLIETGSNFKKPRAEEFSTYKSIEGGFSFKYPSAFLLDEQEFEGTEILYHVGFKDRSNTSHGFVQVWNLPYDLNEFLSKSKSTSEQQYKQFEEKAVTVNSIPGILWDYTVITHDNKSYKGNEVFLKKDDKMYRISYFVPERLWSKNESKLFESIVSSFKTNAIEN
ncbi:PsbP-related protein [Acetivibrio straminisolvens]|nr:PsbP-related protein [Acetivibrio straminisolvens]